MEAIVSNSRSTFTAPIDTILLSEIRTVFIEEPIGKSTANDFKKAILFLLHKDTEKPITIHINSEGGEVTQGLLIYDIIKQLDQKNIEVNIVCTGIAYSIAAVIFAGAPKNHRLILPRSRVFLHQPYISGGVEGNASNIRKTAEELMKTEKEIVTLLSADTGRGEEEIEQAIASERFLTAQEAVEFGIADRIVSTLF